MVPSFDDLSVISRCSGGGKSTLLAELGRQGHATVEEPGRRIVAQEISTGGRVLPWIDLPAFARRAIDMARQDRAALSTLPDAIFFDRGLVDAAAALEFATGEPALAALTAEDRYNRRVFLAPPWPEIFVTDAERRHGYDEAVAEYGRIVDAYAGLGYEIVLLPKVGIAERADFILRSLPRT